MIEGFERFVAWRYLTDGGRRSRVATLLVGLTLTLIGIVVSVAAQQWVDAPPEVPLFMGGFDGPVAGPYQWLHKWWWTLEIGVGALLLGQLGLLLSAPRRRTAGAVVLMLLTAAAGVGVYLAPGLLRQAGELNWQRITMLVGGGFLVVGVLVMFFGVLLLFFSIFTTISTYGVFLGTGALVIVLSVMNGFAVDLRKKILGSNAHVLVSRVDGRFTDYERVVAEARKVSGVRAASPFVSTEIVVSSPSNYQGVILKGIDPRTVGAVSDLAKNLVEPAGVTSEDVLKSLSPPPGWEEGGPLLPDPEEEEVAPEPTAEPAASPEPKAGATGEADKTPEVRVLTREQRDALLETADGADTDTDTDAVAAGDGDGSGPDGGELTEAELDELYKDDPLGRPLQQPSPLSSPAEATLPGVIIGRELAKNLGNVEVGDELTIVSTLPSLNIDRTSPSSRPVRIAGIFFSGMYEYDTKHVYVMLPVAQSFLGLKAEGVDPAVTGVEIKANSIEGTGPVVAALEARLGPEYKVQDWKTLNRNLFSALKPEKIAMFIVLTIIILVASFSIISNLIMVVVEKQREIAILKSMGASNGSVLRTFMYQGVYIGLIGMLGGVSFGVGACVYLKEVGLPLDAEVYYIDKLPVAMEPLAVLAVAGAALAISFIATLYPSWIAAGLRPVDGLRND